MKYRYVKTYLCLTLAASVGAGQASQVLTRGEESASQEDYGWDLLNQDIWAESAEAVSGESEIQEEYQDLWEAPLDTGDQAISDDFLDPGVIDPAVVDPAVDDPDFFGGGEESPQDPSASEPGAEQTQEPSGQETGEQQTQAPGMDDFVSPETDAGIDIEPDIFTSDDLAPGQPAEDVIVAGPTQAPSQPIDVGSITPTPAAQIGPGVMATATPVPTATPTPTVTPIPTLIPVTPAPFTSNPSAILLGSPTMISYSTDMVSNIHAGKEFYLKSLKDTYKLTFSDNFADIMEQIEQEYRVQHGLSTGTGTGTGGPLIVANLLSPAGTATPTPLPFLTMDSRNTQILTADLPEGLLVRNWQDILAIYVYEQSKAGKTAYMLDLSAKNDLARIFAYLNPVEGEGKNAYYANHHINYYIRDNKIEKADRDILKKYTETDCELLCATVTGAKGFVRQSVGDNVSEERVDVITAAYSLVGKVGYFWGGKSTMIGMDPNWGSASRVYATGSNTTGTLRAYGLDCSGFVTWAVINGYKDRSMFYQIGDGTSAQWLNAKVVSEANAQPGDLVFQSGPEAGADNHVGILVGKTDTGDWIAIHCSSGQNGVTVGEAYSAGFRYIREPSFYPAKVAEVRVASVDNLDDIVVGDHSITVNDVTINSDFVDLFVSDPNAAPASDNTASSSPYSILLEDASGRTLRAGEDRPEHSYTLAVETPGGLMTAGSTVETLPLDNFTLLLETDQGGLLLEPGSETGTPAPTLPAENSSPAPAYSLVLDSGQIIPSPTVMPGSHTVRTDEAIPILELGEDFVGAEDLETERVEYGPIFVMANQEPEESLPTLSLEEEPEESLPTLSLGRNRRNPCRPSAWRRSRKNPCRPSAWRRNRRLSLPLLRRRSFWTFSHPVITGGRSFRKIPQS